MKPSVETCQPLTRTTFSVWQGLAANLYVRRIYVFALLAIVYTSYALKFPTPPFFGGDAEHYWRLGSTFFGSGQFNLLNGEATFRGYLLPIIFGFLRQTGIGLNIGEFRPFYLVNGLLTSASLAVVIPWLFQRVCGIRPSNIQIALFGGFFFFFWRGYLVEPLADTWSIFIILISIAFVIYSEARAGWKRAGALLLAGLAMGIAVNLRPIYLICAPLLFAGILNYSFKYNDTDSFFYRITQIMTFPARSSTPSRRVGAVAVPRRRLRHGSRK